MVDWYQLFKIDPIKAQYLPILGIFSVWKLMGTSKDSNQVAQSAIAWIAL